MTTTNTPNATSDAAASTLPHLTPITLPPSGPVRRAKRLFRIGMLGSRYFAPVVGRTVIRRKGNAPEAARRMFERLGATYMKFGQFAASAPGIVGEEIAAEFRSCLDSGRPVPFADVKRTVEAELGRPLGAMFARFSETPLASASIAVVHRATLLDGTEVAVKVLRPDIEQTVATDIRMMEWFARFMAARGTDAGYSLVGLMVSLRDQIAEELDLRNEAKTMDIFSTLFEQFGLSILVVPGVHNEYSSRRVLTMEFLDGSAIDDMAHIGRPGVDPKALVRALLHAWVLTGLRVGAFHADIHAGNLLLLKDGRLGMVDWGIVARLEGPTQALFRNLCRASIGEDVWQDIANEMIEANGASFYALGLTDEQIYRFTRASFEPVLTLPLSEVSMADMFLTGDDVVERATGERPKHRSLRQKLGAMRVAGRVYQSAVKSRSFESSTMRMGFLSSKQLVYLERYGRMYIPDESLLGGHDFLRRALADSADRTGT